MTINLRLIIGFSIVLLMMVLLTVVGIYRVNVIDTTITQINDVNSVKQRYAINFRGSVHDRAIAIRDVVFARNTSELNADIENISHLDKFYQESASEVGLIASSDQPLTADEKIIYDKINLIEKKTLPLISSIINAKQNGDADTAKSILLNQARPAFVEWLAVINEFIDHEEAINQVATKKARAVASSFQNWMLILTSIAIFIGVFVAYRISFQVKNSVGGEPLKAAKVVAKMSQGDLTEEIISCCPMSMMASVGIMQKQFKSTINSIISSSDELSDRATSVAAGSLQSL